MVSTDNSPCLPEGYFLTAFHLLLLLSRFSRVRLCDPIDSTPPGLCPWDSPGKNTGVGCHFLLQCMRVKSESEVAQSCPTLRDPMDCSLPGSFVHGIFQASVLDGLPFPSPLPPTGESEFSVMKRIHRQGELAPFPPDICSLSTCFSEQVQ